MNMDDLKKIGDKNLTESETQALILEAVQKKLAEQEKRIRDEYDAKYDAAIARVATASQHFMEDNVEEGLRGVIEETEALKAAKESYKRKEQELEESYRAKYAESEEKMKQAVLIQQSMLEESLGKEIAEIGNDRETFFKKLHEIHEVMTETAAKIFAETKDGEETRLQEIAKLKAETRRKVNEIEETMQKTETANAQKLADAIATLQSFNEEAIGEEFKELHEQVQNFEVEKKKMKADYIKVLEVMTAVMDDLVTDFKADHQKLVAERVQLNAKGEQLLIEAKREYVAKAAEAGQQFMEAAWEKFIEEHMEDIRVAKQNQLGQQMFEAVNAAFMSSGFAQTPDVKLLQEQLEESRALVAQAQGAAQIADEKKRLLETKTARAAKLNEICGPLPASQRMIMEKMLADVETDKLDEEFKKYLGEVMKLDDGAANAAPKKTPKKQQVNLVEVADGDKKSRVTEGKLGDPNKYENDGGMTLGNDVLNLVERLKVREGWGMKSQS